MTARYRHGLTETTSEQLATRRDSSPRRAFAVGAYWRAEPNIVAPRLTIQARDLRESGGLASSEAFIQKPFSPDDFVGSVRGMIDLLH